MSSICATPARRNHSRSRRASLGLALTLAAGSLVFAGPASADWISAPYTPTTFGQIDSPQVAINPDQTFGFLFGDIDVVNQAWYQSLSASGTPTAPVLFSDADGGGDQQIFSNPDGSQTVVWRSLNGPSDVIWAHITPGGTIGAPQHTGSSPSGSPSAIADSEGTVTALWRSDTAIDYIRISSGGSSTSVNTLIDPDPGTVPAMAADRNGNTYVSWPQLESGTNAARIRIIKIDGQGNVSDPWTAATFGADYSSAGRVTIAASPAGDLLIGAMPFKVGAPPMGTSYPWSLKLRAGEKTGVATPVSGSATSKAVSLLPTIGNSGGRMIVVTVNPAIAKAAIDARPVMVDGSLGSAVPIVGDPGAGSPVLAVADAAGTTTVVYTDSTDHGHVVRLPLGASAATARDLFPGHDARALQMTTTQYGDIAITGGVDADAGARIDYFASPPVCQDAAASTAHAAPVEITTSCASRGPQSGYALAAQPAHGTASITSDGTARYTPAADFGGSDSLTYTVTNGNGVSAPATIRIQVAPAPVTPSDPGSPPVVTPIDDPTTTTTAPVISKLSLTRRTFALSANTTAKAAQAKRKPKPPVLGTTVRFTLSKTARTSIAITQRVAGRLSGKRCVAPRKGLTKHCTRTVAVVTLTRAGTHAGANSVAFSGRVGHTKLAPGHYTATLTATDTAGNRSKAQSITFTVVRR